MPQPTKRLRVLVIIRDTGHCYQVFTSHLPLLPLTCHAPSDDIDVRWDPISGDFLDSWLGSVMHFFLPSCDPDAHIAS